jgi:hypothetical protein
VTGVIATTNGISDDDAGPQNAVDGSGLDADDQHSTASTDMWLADPPEDEALYIQYEFDRLYKLHEMLVWNYNVEFELLLGFGLKDVTIEYSENGTDWTVLGDAQLAQATARATYAANTTIDLQGVAARFVRLTVNSGWGTRNRFGLSEVRFLYVPAHATRPQPADGDTDVELTTTLRWRPGREATSHTVYFGADRDAVADGTAPAATVSENRYTPDGMEFAGAYYWRVDETDPAGAWEGDVWSFTVQPYALIDDFEAYTDDIDAGEAIFDTWLDGWVNETGSIVGYLEAPFAERSIVHSGMQSMPLAYDNTTSPYYSEAYRTWPTAQDWTAGAADTVTLHFRGHPDNAPGTLYVALEDSNGRVAAVSHADPDATLATQWQPWPIPLDAFSDAGVNLARISTMYIGIGDRNSPSAGGKGTIYIDDIMFGRPATD